MFKTCLSWFKKSFLAGIGIIILLLMLININKQIMVMLAAFKENKEIRVKNEKLEKEIGIMELKIKEATSSSYLQRQARELFGLGSEDDYWLVLPDNKNIAGDFLKMNRGDEEPNWRQWLGLFW